MSQKNYTHIAIVLDRSGSMANIAKDMEGGLKSLIDEQKKLEGKATITLARFDDHYDVVYDFSDISTVSDFSLSPRGMTALLDAMGKTMESVRSKIMQMDDADKPEKVVFVFVTDGQENASKQYKRNRIFEMISDLSNKDGNNINQPDNDGITWDFKFIGANQDAINEGKRLGIRDGASLNFMATSNGSAEMFTTLTRSISSYRTQGIEASNFTEQERNANGQQLDTKLTL